MRRYDPGDPIALRYTATDESDVPVAVTGALTLTKPDGTTYEGTPQTGGTGIIDVLIPAAQAVATPSSGTSPATSATPRRDTSTSGLPRTTSHRWRLSATWSRSLATRRWTVSATGRSTCSMKQAS
jgi:hypothetical protein